MIPWIELDRAPLPLGGELRLMRRGHEFVIKVGVAELMTSRLNASETALATLAAEALGGRTKPRILIGGLGMGFTLRAALDAFGPGAEIVVAELVPAVVRWARGPMAELFGGSLDDARVRIVEADVARLIPTQAALRRDPARCRQRPGRHDAGRERSPLFDPGPEHGARGARARRGARRLVGEPGRGPSRSDSRRRAFRSRKGASAPEASTAAQDM